MLDNIPHIKAYWIMLGIGTAQTALAYGADDIDGTVRHELIYHDAGATTPELLTCDQIQRLIVEAGREPVERDTRCIDGLCVTSKIRHGGRWGKNCWLARRIWLLHGQRFLESRHLVLVFLRARFARL